MLPILYLALLVGVSLLVADLLGRLHVQRRRLRWWRAIGALATVFVAVQPAIFGLRNPGGIAYPFHLIAGAYLASGAIYLGGMAAGDGSVALAARRIGYGMLLVLGALPSWLLLFLTPVIAMAGIGLARPNSRTPA